MKSIRSLIKRSLQAVSAMGSILYANAVLALDLEFDPEVGGIEKPLQNASGLGDQDPAAIAFAVTNTALIFLGTITLIMIIVAGFMWLLAAGEEERITKAKDILKGSVVGLIIVMGSYGLAQYVFAAIQSATLAT